MREDWSETRVAMKHLFENHDLATSGAGEFVDVTEFLRDLVSRSDVTNGIAVAYSPHTTCTLMINEHESGFFADFNDALESLVPAVGTTYRHDERQDTPNGHAHVRAALLGAASQAIPIVDGRLLLGRYQRIFFCELDRARPRKVLLQVLGD